MTRAAPLELVRGDDVRLDVDVRDANGQLVPLTGAVATWRAAAVLRATGAPTGAAVLTVSGDVAASPTGRVEVALTSPRTLGLPVGQYLWQLEVSLAGVASVVAEGLLTVRPKVA